MTVGEYIATAKYSVLNQLAIKDNNEALIVYINQSLQAVSEEFSLVNKEAIVDLVDNKITYGFDEAIWLVDNTGVKKPLTDVMYITGVYDELGYELPLNNEKDGFAVLTPTYNEIQVPNAATGASISIVYVANPARLTFTPASTTTPLVGDADTLGQVIPVPAQLIKAMLMYTGYLAHGAISSNVQTDNNVHYLRYQAEVARIRNLGLITSDDVDFKFSTRDKGFA
jgi:hypothetical protein